MFTTAEEAHQATLQAWETILRGHGEWNDAHNTVERLLGLVYFPETAFLVTAVTTYQGRTLCRTRRGRITLLRAPHKEAHPMNNKQLLKATAAAMLADALAGYVSTERLANYLAQHGWQRRPEEEAAHKYVEMVFTAPITADDGSDIYLVIYQQKTADWLGKPLPIMSALDLVAAVEERSKLAVLLEWLNPAHAEAVRQLLVALEQSEVT